MELLPPPREVPTSLNLAVRFGSPLQQTGWLLFGLGLVFWWIFGAQADASGFLFHLKGSELVGGEVVASRPTGWSEDSKGSKGRIYEIDYRYRTPDGASHSDESFAAGWAPASGTKVEVEWVPAATNLARIRGTRRAPLSPWVLFVLATPTVGALFLLLSAPRTRRTVRLLREGECTRGVLKSKRPTATKINNRRVYALTFEFLAYDGSVHRVTTRTSRPERLEDEASERLVYDRGDPDRAATLDDLPGGAVVGEDGTLAPVPPGKVAAILLAPTLTLVGHGVYLLVRALH